MKYNKQPLDIPAQIAMLKGRGLNIADEQAAEKTLNRISYFRLAAYLRPMEADKNTHQYKLNATFENAVALYEFDAELREMVFRAIGKIEIALRTKMIHHLLSTQVALQAQENPVQTDDTSAIHSGNHRTIRCQCLYQHLHELSK